MRANLMQIQFFLLERIANFRIHNRTETEMPQIKNLIGRMHKNTRAARTART